VEVPELVEDSVLDTQPLAVMVELPTVEEEAE